ncbi:MAG: ribonuclease E activity regulator RraA [Pseudomonadaceae bacterium]|nr:ribonuclease E activity regulator RraA [Pseudomonadaceae bacterium]
MTDQSQQQLSLPDLCDEHRDVLAIAEPGYRHFGGRQSFHGEIRTIRCFEDNSLVGEALRAEGDGCVLVVDGGGSHRCALVGDNLALAGRDNGWAGVIVYGCVRDVEIMADIDFGVVALAPHPMKSVKRGAGDLDTPVHFAGVRWLPGAYAYVDMNGMACAPNPLHR